MDRVSATLRVHYLTHTEIQPFCAMHNGHLLGAIAYGAGGEREAPDCPFARIHLPTLEQPPVLELWTSGQPVVRQNQRGIDTARNEEVLFGCLQVDANAPLDNSVYDAYCRIFDIGNRLGYSHLLRVWHYLPRINEDSDGLERYRRFNVGRHEAFRSRNRSVEHCAPAACALGTREGPFTIYFLAAREAGEPVSNPRQLDPYRYPTLYGPRGPAFSRAMLAKVGGEPVLFISGTASIVGHETVHAGDAIAQADETAENLRAVMGQFRAKHSEHADDRAQKCFRVYVKNPENLYAVRERMNRAFTPENIVIYLQADICRSDLLLEVEGVLIAGASA